MRRLRVALAQINSTVGDLDGNVLLAASAIDRARTLGADLVALPELAITGYPPEDLVLRPQFILDNRAALDDLASQVHGILAVIGFVGGGPDRNDGEPVRNSAALLWDGAIAHIYHKIVLPNYGVFDPCARTRGRGRSRPRRGRLRRSRPASRRSRRSPRRDRRRVSSRVLQRRHRSGSPLRQAAARG